MKTICLSFRRTSDGAQVLRQRDSERGGSRMIGRGYDWPDLFPGDALRLATAAAMMPARPVVCRPVCTSGGHRWRRDC